LVEASNQSLVRDRKIYMQRFNEWMSFRQTVETGESDYTFLGTYDTESIPDLQENSDPVDLDHAMNLIPEIWRKQFPNVGTVMAGKTTNENNNEILWISLPDQSTAYLFEKTK